ncbi:MFS transporter [Saccharothrix sp. ALI-22-I]|uniref:MFS transporter n=1 Tax=Saccharothrix sp. ALI-22-I TaxID=1933778 RepID=UPI001930F555|nr:MFS transporter [Saccharothrix sp. ALI-22-I]
MSEFGSSITYVAMPLVALTVLDASSFEVGVLTAMSSLAFLLISLPAGVVVDRSARKKLMLWSNVGRAALVGVVPLLAALDALEMVHLYVVAFFVGVLTVLFEIAYQSFVPSVVTKDQLVDANGKLSTTQSLSVVLGPPLGGGLVALMGATRVMAVDALSYLVSVVSLLLLPMREEPPAKTAGFSWDAVRRETAEGLSFVFGHPVLRKVVACTATSNFFGAMYFALEMVFFVKELNAGPLLIGLAISAGGAGGVLGGLTARRVSTRVGSARMIWVSVLGLGWTGVLVPLAGPGWGFALIAVGLFGFSLSAVLYNTAQVSYRQAVCPPELLGRVNASVRWVVWGTLPVGALVAGWLATSLGVRETLLVAGAGGWLAGLWVYFSPIRGMRDVPTTEPVTA